MADLERGSVEYLTQYMFTRDDGSQVLLDCWWLRASTGDHLSAVSIAERDQRGGVWGPPLEGVRC